MICILRQSDWKFKKYNIFFLSAPCRCECGNCRIDLLQNEKECQCCQEIDGCIEAVNIDIVMQEANGVPQCIITLHPGFECACLANWSLRLAGPKYRRMDKRKYKIGSDENRY